MTRNKALDILFHETPTDHILAEHETLKFFEFHVTCGGDCCTFRIYKENGEVYEKWGG